MGIWNTFVWFETRLVQMILLQIYTIFVQLRCHIWYMFVTHLEQIIWNKRKVCNTFVTKEKFVIRFVTNVCGLVQSLWFVTFIF